MSKQSSVDSVVAALKTASTLVIGLVVGGAVVAIFQVTDLPLAKIVRYAVFVGIAASAFAVLAYIAYKTWLTGLYSSLALAWATLAKAVENEPHVLATREFWLNDAVVIAKNALRVALAVGSFILALGFAVALVANLALLGQLQVLTVQTERLRRQNELIALQYEPVFRAELQMYRHTTDARQILDAPIGELYIARFKPHAQELPGWEFPELAIPIDQYLIERLIIRVQAGSWGARYRGRVESISLLVPIVKLRNSGVTAASVSSVQIPGRLDEDWLDNLYTEPPFYSCQLLYHDDAARAPVVVGAGDSATVLSDQYHVCINRDTGREVESGFLHNFLDDYIFELDVRYSSELGDFQTRARIR